MASLSSALSVTGERPVVARAARMPGAVGTSARTDVRMRCTRRSEVAGEVAVEQLDPGGSGLHPGSAVVLERDRLEAREEITSRSRSSSRWAVRNAHPSSARPCPALPG